MTPARPTVDVDGLAELLAAATPGPWREVPARDGLPALVCAGDTVIADLDDFTKDAAIIVAAVNALPGLLEHLAAVTAERDEARAAVERVHSWLDDQVDSLGSPFNLLHAYALRAALSPAPTDTERGGGE